MKGAIVLCLNTGMNIHDQDNSRMWGREGWKMKTVCSLWKRKQKEVDRQDNKSAWERLWGFRGKEKVASGIGSVENVNPPHKIEIDELMKYIKKGKGYQYVMVKALSLTEEHMVKRIHFKEAWGTQKLVFLPFSNLLFPFFPFLFSVSGRPTVLCGWGQ